MIPVLIGVVVLLVVVALWFVAMYNRLVRLRNQAEEAWAGIDVQLTRRHDLIPNLVETVKGYASHERETLENVIQARTAAVSAAGPQQQAQAENFLTGALRQLFALAEAYPQLKADANFRELQAELANTEGLLATSRATYNATVRQYDTAREVFPTNIVAGMFNFAAREYFETTDPDARGPVTVEF
jgi:LemA protein